MVRLDRGGAAIVDEVPAGRIASDGKSLLPIGGAVLQQRRRVGVDGSAVATLVVDRAGSLAAPPQISLIGLAEATAGAGRRRVRRADRRASEGLPAPQRRDDEALRDTARRVLRARAQGTLRQAPADRHPAGPDLSELVVRCSRER